MMSMQQAIAACYFVHETPSRRRIQGQWPTTVWRCWAIIGNGTVHADQTFTLSNVDSLLSANLERNCMQASEPRPGAG